MGCKEQLPDELQEEPHDASLQVFLADALNLSPQPAMPSTLFGGSFGGSLLGSPLSRLEPPEHHQMFYGGSLADLSASSFNDIADSSFSFGCFS